MEEAMSQLLEAAARLDPQRAADLTRSDGELASKTRLYRVTIGRNEPLTIEAASSFAAWDLALDVAGPTDRIEVQLLTADAKVEPFPIAAARHHVVLAELRDDAQRIATQTLYEAGDLTLEDLAQIDRQYHQKKVSGALRVRDDAFAAAADLQQLDAMRRVGAI